MQAQTMRSTVVSPKRNRDPLASFWGDGLAIEISLSVARRRFRAQVGHVSVTKDPGFDTTIVSRDGMACLTQKMLDPKIAKALKG